MTDVTVVGSGPNGLAAAMVAAHSGLRVRVIEASGTLGGGARTAELLESGFRHDVCSAVHPMALASPFFREAGLERVVEFLVPEVSYAQGIAPGRSALAYRDLERTIEGLRADGRVWRGLFAAPAASAGRLGAATLGVPRVRPSDVASLLGLGTRAAAVAASGLRAGFLDDGAPALLAGLAAHAIGDAHSLAAMIVGLTLGAHAHAGGWPVPRGGSQSIVDVMVAWLRARSVEFETGHRVSDIGEVADSRLVFLDVTPRAAVSILGDALPTGRRRRYERFTYGPGVAKVDYTLDEPVPWLDPGLARSGTVHLGGPAATVLAGEREITRGRLSDEPFVMVSVPSMFDSTRAPAGKHVVWAYVHTPSGWDGDAERIVTARIEQFAPGFRDLIRASTSRSAVGYAEYNENYVGGDISAGRTTLRQLVGRPVLSLEPWRTGAPGVYLCSSSTAPGPGVHGMAGAHAARLALAREFGMDAAELAADPPRFAG